MILKPKDRTEWLKMRQNGIGGSDAGAVLGKNKYKSNVQLWEEKTGLTVAEDISDKPAVRFGKSAEEYLRGLFRLEHPEYELEYHEFYMYVNDDFPFIYATLDGELTAPDGRRGILEIKTTTIQNANQWDEWDGRIPDSYYAQVLHQLAATGWDFAIVWAYIRYHRDGEWRATIRPYTIDRSDVEGEIKVLIERETEFWKSVMSRTRPPLKLPEI